jgi:dihydrodipicolinate synthase/N-acetylneuraminate lyase
MPVFFEGVYAAILTPFDANGHFHQAAYERLMDHLYNSGVHGLYCCGVSGEGLMMSVAERQAVAEAAVAGLRKRGKVLVHVGSGNTEDSAALARHAARIGADGVGCLAPYTNNYGIEALVDHFAAVAEAARPLPTLVYYTPAIAPSLNHYAQLERLLDLPLIAGVKFTGTDASELAYAICERGERQTVLSGVDENFAPALLMGAHGAIGSFVNVAPDLFAEIYALARKGEWERAREVQRQIVKIVRVTERYPFLSALKNTVTWQGCECGEPRRPQPALSAEEKAELRGRLEALGMRFPSCMAAS